MGTIICQTCNDVVDYFENEKVVILYGQCTCCDKAQEETK